MNVLPYLVSGAVIGFSVTAPVGPMAMLCINRTLSAGLKAGLSTGAGASTVQAAYASVVLLGLQQIGPFLASARPVLTVLSATLMVLFAIRTIRGRPGTRSGAEGSSVLRNYLTAIALNGLNPMLLLLLVGAVGAVVGPEPPLGPIVAVILVGVFLGSVCWWIVLSSTVAAVGNRLGARLVLGINRIAGAGMLGFAVLSVGRLAGA